MRFHHGSLGEGEGAHWSAYVPRNCVGTQVPTPSPHAAPCALCTGCCSQSPPRVAPGSPELTECGTTGSDHQEALERPERTGLRQGLHIRFFSLDGSLRTMAPSSQPCPPPSALWLLLLFGG